jgi:hypothetical protein
MLDLGNFPDAVFIFQYVAGADIDATDLHEFMPSCGKYGPAAVHAARALSLGLIAGQAG